MRFEGHLFQIFQINNLRSLSRWLVLFEIFKQIINAHLRLSLEFDYFLVGLLWIWLINLLNLVRVTSRVWVSARYTIYIRVLPHIFLFSRDSMLTHLINDSLTLMYHLCLILLLTSTTLSLNLMRIRPGIVCVCRSMGILISIFRKFLPFLKWLLLLVKILILHLYVTRVSFIRLILSIRHYNLLLSSFAELGSLI